MQIGTLIKHYNRKDIKIPPFNSPIHKEIKCGIDSDLSGRLYERQGEKIAQKH
jgi:hypothetical protein